MREGSPVLAAAAAAAEVQPGRRAAGPKKTEQNPPVSPLFGLRCEKPEQTRSVVEYRRYDIISTRSMRYFEVILCVRGASSFRY